NYSNDNFSQRIYYDNSNSEVNAYIKNSNYFGLEMNFRVRPDKKYIAGLHPELRETVTRLLDGSVSFKAYFENISYFLESDLTYDESPMPQDALSVIQNKKANCIGYSNLVKIMLDAARIKNQVARGFYLKKIDKKIKKRSAELTPVPHRWLEISLTNGTKFFYDPQHQSFSAHYIATPGNIDFKRVKRFKVNLIKRSKKIIN
ncbi:MAG: hypothetical protein GY765_29415, partial [bacterium]|nr:hypothetical protein [bacterium]